MSATHSLCCYLLATLFVSLLQTRRSKQMAGSTGLGRARFRGDRIESGGKTLKQSELSCALLSLSALHTSRALLKSTAAFCLNISTASSRELQAAATVHRSQ